MSDVLFLICLFTCSPVLLVKVRHPFLVFAGIFVPMSLASTMLYLWLDVGTANANYFFFQMLTMWIFIAVLLIEYSRATLQSIRKLYGIFT
jgi:low temperature requirement protein LtrA